MNNLYISPTSLTRRFFKCEMAWYNHAVLRIERRSQGASPALDRGKAMHAIIEHALRVYAETGEVFTFAGDAGYAVAEQIFGKLYDDESVTLTEEVSHELLEAARFHLPQLGMEDWEVLTVDGKPLVEAELRAPWIEGVDLLAVIDLVFRHTRTGKVWFVDWKTTEYAINMRTTPARTEFDYQLFIGRRILEHHGINVDFSALVEVRSLAPSPPKIVNKGKRNEGPSTDKGKLTCDWPTYEAVLRSYGRDPNSKEAAAVRDHLNNLTFVRWRTDMTNANAEAAMRGDLTKIAERMLLLSKDRSQSAVYSLRTQAPRSGCNTCEYRAWCTAALRRAGFIDLSLLGTDYVAREGSPLAGQHRFDSPPFDADAAYVAFAAKHGRTIQPHEEFRP